MRNSNKAVLTAKRIERLGAVGRYPDARVPGLCYQISRTGGRSWVLRYALHRKERMLGLGRADLVSVDEARERAWAAWKLILDGTDPVERKRATVVTLGGLTFQEACDRYIASHKAGWKNAKHAAQWGATLSTYAWPVIGALSVAQIDTAAVMQVLEQEPAGYPGKTLWTAIPETASRLRQRTEAILDWAKARGFRTGENPARWRGHLDKLLPARAKIAKVEHQPALPYADIPAFMGQLRERGGVAARALEFLILTACRSGEVAGARWSEIDLGAKVWIIRAERMKAGREHRVPLTDAVIKLIERIPSEADSDYIFVGPRAGHPISNAAMAKVMKELAAPSTTPGRIATMHGMRSTFRDWAAEITNFPREVAEAALAHTLINKVEAAYQRGDLILRRRKLMEEWDRYCHSPVPAGDRVVPMRRVAE